MKNLLKENLANSYNSVAQERNNGETDDWKVKERDIFLEYLKKENKLNLLDVGAGGGRDSEFFKDNGLKTISIDISSESIEICKQKGLEAYIMDFYELNFDKQKFDCIWALNSLLHVPKDDLNKVLLEIKRVLNENGLLYFGTYGGYNFEGIFENDSYEPKRFFSFYTSDDLKKSLKEHFEIKYFNSIYIERKDMDFYSIILRKRH